MGPPGPRRSSARKRSGCGIEEVNFGFDGHVTVRTRGLRILNHEELKAGDVSLAYVSQLMNRRYTDTPTFRKVLQSIWYQVNAGQEIFVVGTILPDPHVKGGTGWGAEFAKLCNKPLHVYDQEKDGWFTWDDRQWVARTGADLPTIEHAHFTGTGTRTLTAARHEGHRVAVPTLVRISSTCVAAAAAHPPLRRCGRSRPCAGSRPHTAPARDCVGRAIPRAPKPSAWPTRARQWFGGPRRLAGWTDGAPKIDGLQVAWARRTPGTCPSRRAVPSVDSDAVHFTAG